MIAWHGLADGSTQESSTLDWYARVAREDGSIAEAKSFARLFQVPGLYHGGGYINYSLSLLPKLIDWVETGTAPEVVIATATTPVPRTYPSYVYPARARYTGTGSVYDAANWTRATRRTSRTTASTGSAATGRRSASNTGRGRCTRPRPVHFELRTDRLILRLRIFPVGPFGNSSTIATCRGYL